MKPPNVLSSDQIAGVVVLYNSPASCLDSIKTYWLQVQKLYIIDNSPTTADWLTNLLSENTMLVYMHFPANIGIASALNAAAQQAGRDGFAYLLTMDDDSQAPTNYVRQMVNYLNQTQSNDIGIVAPRHALTTARSGNTMSDSTEPRQVQTAMTSGNLLDLAIFNQLGGFCDDLFIDVVDHEYNLNLKKHHYRLIELPYLGLTHRLGFQKKRLGLRFVSHTPVRNYYLVRNSIYVAGQYKKVAPGYIVYALKIVAIEAVKAALLEDQSRHRLYCIWKGIRDGLGGKLGKAYF